jgi:hypothetical protein
MLQKLLTLCSGLLDGCLDLIRFALRLVLVSAAINVLRGIARQLCLMAMP